MNGPRATIVVNNRDPRVWHRIDLCNASLVAQSLFAAREYRPLLRRRSASVIAERRAMTHGARISRESDVARVIPNRERKQIAGGGWGRKNISIALSRRSGRACQMRRAHRLLAEWSKPMRTRDFDIAVPDERVTRCYRVT